MSRGICSRSSVGGPVSIVLGGEGLTGEWVRYDVTPVAKPRMTRRDRWSERRSVIRYRGFKDMLRFLQAELPDCAHIIFVLPMPRSWSAPKKAAHRGTLHRQRPDVDNLHKGLLDAIYPEDSHVADARITKVWGDTGAILVKAIHPWDAGQGGS